MRILGINAYHADSAACVVVDGKLVAAAEEERFRRIKHWAGLPTEAMAYCLDEAGLSIGDVTHVAVNRDPRANLWRRAAYVALRRPDWRLVVNRLRNRRSWMDLGQAISATFPGYSVGAELVFVEHHLAHLASAYLVSPFDNAVAVSVDGFGDFASTAWGRGRGDSLAVDGRVHFPHSLGIFYQAMTQFLGFHGYGDEYKVMGLSSFGRPTYADRIRDMLELRGDGRFSLNLRYFVHHRENVPYRWSGGAPEVGRLYHEDLESLLGPARRADEPIAERHQDIAKSAQAVYEEAFLGLLNAKARRYDSTNLVLAGGCAQNSAANGKILANTPFESVYVHPAAGDAGGAVGAALVAWNRFGSGERATRMTHAAWGPAFDDQAIEDVLASRAEEIAAHGCAVRRAPDEVDLADQVAIAIADGAVVGWFQGRMEWGPRALGNRSILCDPRRTDAQELLNDRIKRREPFRPFAPAILREQVSDWFTVEDDVPFMAKVYPIRPERRAEIPAVTHVDGTGRLQTVEREANPKFHALIAAFAKRTGVPILLNTSFNENEPIVRGPDEALACFLRTRMDMLAIGGHLVVRSSAMS